MRTIRGSRTSIQALALWLALVPGLAQQNTQDLQISPSTPTEIAGEILSLMNHTRSAQGLRPLTRMPVLEEIAEAHCRDMAGRRTLSHASSSGLSYTERLLEAEIFFEAAAENVAFSDSFVAAFIHQSLLDSPGHRENILNGEFDRVGVAVVLEPGDGYYVTQDFIRSLGPGLNMEDLENHVLEFEERTRERINRLRQQQGLPPFVYLEEADAHAKEYLERRAAGLPPPVLPLAYRGIHILYVFINAPSLEKAEAEFDQVTQPHTNTGGMGVRFSRSEDALGGAYEFAFILFLDKNYAAMSVQEHVALVADQITLLRTDRGLRAIQIDRELSWEAQQISRSMRNRQGEAVVFPAQLTGFRIESYITANPLDIPVEIASDITVPGIQRLGLGVVFQPDGDLPTGRFWVTLVFR